MIDGISVESWALTCSTLQGNIFLLLFCFWFFCEEFVLDTHSFVYFLLFMLLLLFHCGRGSKRIVEVLFFLDIHDEWNNCVVICLNP
ncbi:hypothetical protein QBC38DRAFT_490056 [Podospora fimiseda]|uniref:Uncharacterized protein n=1 Tax=Podospora fimiseda TaxID=252190 RepID=A0AAN7BE34_9PEZI|nr:hypothetical protein QBC38DRAFT_490056 [Podospora fimiseda]